MGKKRSMSPGLRKRLQGVVNIGRRETLYKMIEKKCGVVNCYVCGKPITKIEYATIEHIIPLSVGGLNEMSNMWLSHAKCNHARGNNTDYSCVGISDEQHFK